MLFFFFKQKTAYEIQAEVDKITAEAKEKAAAAESQARDVLKQAEDKASNIQAEVDKIVAEAKEKTAAIEQQAQDILKRAEEKEAEVTPADREKAKLEAERILNEARSEAERLLKQRDELNEAKVQHAMREVSKQAEKAIQLIGEAEQLLTKSKRTKKLTEAEAKEIFKTVHDKLTAISRSISETIVMPSSEAGKALETARVEPATPSR